MKKLKFIEAIRKPKGKKLSKSKKQQKSQKKQKVRIIQNGQKGFIFGRIKVGYRLAISFALITILIVILAVLSINSTEQIASQTEVLQKTAGAKFDIAQARINQEKYEKTPSEEMINEVNSKLNESVLFITEVQSMLDSTSVDNIVTEFLEQIETFKEDFITYTELEEAKIKKAKMLRATTDLNRDNVESMIKQGIVSIETAKENRRNALEAERIAEETGTNESDEKPEVEEENLIEAAYEQLSTLTALNDSFLAVQIAMGNYIALESEEASQSLVEEVERMRAAIEVAYEGSYETFIKLKIAKVEDSVNLYEVAITEYSDYIARQSVQREKMGVSATLASEAATSIEEEVMKSMDAMEATIGFITIVAVVIVILFSVMIAIVITYSIVRPIRIAVQEMNQVANYDISKDVRFDLLRRKDEVGDICNAIQQVKESFRVIITNITETSNQLAASSEELASTSQQSAESAYEVSKAIEEIANGASEQAKDTDRGVSNVTELGKLIEEDQNQVTLLGESAKVVGELKDDGVEILSNLVTQTERSNEALSTVNAIVMDTNNSANKIVTASQMIQNIASQTNLLALNAAIEAARAGEAGKGFAVVADEIRKLAEQSDSFTKEIAIVIEELIEKAEEAVDTMKVAREITDEQNSGVQATNDKFEGIANAVTDMELRIKSVVDSSTETETKKAQIIDIMGNLAAISEENAAGAEEASASVTEQSMSMEQILNASSELALLAETMQETISKFTI